VEAKSPAWLDELTLRAEGPPWLSMGTGRVAEDAWLLPADDVDELRAVKARLLEARHDDVFQARPGTEVAGREVLALVSEALGREPPSGTSAVHPLEAAARLVAEDLCLLLPAADHDDRLVLAAACVCFPSHWRLADKLGRPVTEVHGVVPGYADELGAKVDGFLAHLRPGQVVARRNWSIHERPDLFSPVCPPSQRVGPAEQWLRSERETMRRLPRTGAVLFTIRVQQCQLAALRDRPDVAVRLAARLRAQPMHLSAYQNLTTRLPELLAWLDELGSTVNRR
jgi:dimethylamine monooxygenase subunit A